MPQRQPTYIICGFILLSLTTTSFAEPMRPQFSRGFVLLADGFKLEVEIANTETQREYGLMHRTNLDENQGMLFIYPKTERQGVWMKNTLLELDVLFLSEQGRVSEILENLQPCRKAPCPIYISTTKVQYMLEVPAGFSVNHGIEPGQEFILEYRHAPQ